MRARALLLGLAAAGCSATRSLETGAAVPVRQVRADARSTWEILAGGPRWIAQDVKRDWAALRTALAGAGKDIARDGRETLDHVTGFPDFLARESARDYRQLRWGLSEAGRRFGEDLDSAETEVSGVPGWFARDWKEGIAGLGSTLRTEAAVARKDAREFPGALAHFFWTGLW